MSLTRLNALLLAGVSMVPTLEAQPKQSPPPPTAARPFAFPKHVTRKLANGLTVYIVEDHRLPLVSYSLDILAGSVREDHKKAGLATMTAALLREGTTTLTSEQLAALVDNAGGSLSASADDEMTTISAGFMKSYGDLGMKLMADITINPKFDQEEIDRQMQQAQSGMSLQYSDPSYIAGLVSDRVLYDRHPYGYPNEGTPQTLRSIRREDLVTFHRSFYAPSNGYLAIAGDITAEEAMARAEKYFGTWKTASPKVEALPAAAPQARRVIVIDMPKTVQSQIFVGQTLVQRNHPDYVPLAVANQIFGGSFNSRLNLKLRANEGLTYGANSSLRPFREGGAFGVKTFTRTEKTGDAIRMILDLLKEFRENPATETEFKEAQRFMIGAFGLSIETAGAVAGRLVAAAVYGLGEEYWETYRHKLDALNVAAVTEPVKRHIQPEKMTIVVVGNAKEFSKQLEAYGPVTIIKIDDLDVISDTLTKPKEKVISSAAGAAKAKQTVELAIAAMGGLPGLSGIKDMTSKGAMKLSTPQGEMNAEATEEVLFPDAFKVTMKLPFGEMIQAFDGKTGWMGQGAMKQDMPSDMGKEIGKGVLTSSAVGLLLTAANGKADVAALEPVELDGRKLDALLWKQGDFAVKMLFDPESHLVTKISYQSLAMGGSAETDSVYSDYRTVSGVKLPFKELIYQNGQKIGERSLTERKINSGLRPDSFQKKP